MEACDDGSAGNSLHDGFSICDRLAILRRCGKLHFPSLQSRWDEISLGITGLLPRRASPWPILIRTFCWAAWRKSMLNTKASRSLSNDNFAPISSDAASSRERKRGGRECESSPTTLHYFAKPRMADGAARRLWTTSCNTAPRGSLDWREIVSVPRKLEATQGLGATSVA